MISQSLQALENFLIRNIHFSSVWKIIRPVAPLLYRLQLIISVSNSFYFMAKLHFMRTVFFSPELYKTMTMWSLFVARFKLLVTRHAEAMKCKVYA